MTFCSRWMCNPAGWQLNRARRSSSTPSARRSVEEIGGAKIVTAITVTHRIAGIVFRTESNAWLPLLQEEPFEQFRIEDTEPDVHQRIQEIDLDALTSSAPATDRLESSPLLRSPAVRARLQASLDQCEQIEVQIDRAQMTLRNFSRCELDFFYTKELGMSGPIRRVNTAVFRVATNFKKMFSTFLPSFSAILVHSSGVIRHDRAALFLAPSSGGKTTVVKRSTGDLILNDDQIVLRQEEGVVVAHGTPLGGITSGPCRARLGGLFLLEQAEQFELSPLAPADVLSHIWGESPNYVFFLPKELRVRAFLILSEACYQAPAYRLRFPRDHVDWDAIDAAMAR